MTHPSKQERQLLKPKDLGFLRWTRKQGKRGRLSAAERAEQAAHNALHDEIAAKLKELYNSQVMGDLLRSQLTHLREYKERKLQEAANDIGRLREQVTKCDQRLVAAHMVFSIERVFDGLTDLTGQPRVGKINHEIPGILEFDIVGLQIKTVAGTKKVHVTSAPETAVKIRPFFAAYEANGKFTADGVALLRFLAEAVTPAGHERLGNLLDPEELKALYDEHGAA